VDEEEVGPDPIFGAVTFMPAFGGTYGWTGWRWFLRGWLSDLNICIFGYICEL